MHATEGQQIETRQERGLRIAALVKLHRKGNGWVVPSQSGNGSYVVDPTEGTCTCPDFETRKVRCKHQFAVSFVIERETKPDGTVTVRKTMKVSYSQQWSAYDAAQTHESERFMELLSGLCAGIEQPLQTMGRPQLPLSDVVFALAVRTFSTMSGRRATGYVRDAEAKGFIDRTPHYSSAFRRLESDELTPLLKSLIEESARPLQAIESDFAIDSTGFATNTYSRWYDAKWGRVRSEQRWIKLHFVTGVTTNIITAAEATAHESADAPQLPSLLQQTAQTFTVQSLSADKAYSSKRNLRAVDALGAVPYIPFKQGTKPVPSVKAEQDALWAKMWHYYNFRRDDFLAHYHVRSNAESTVSMVKAKFGSSVRAKLPTAQVNEVLLKCVCHNLCVLISSIYELCLEPVFWAC